MMLSPEPTNELKHLAKLVRESVYPTKQSDILPAYYNPTLVWLRELKDIPVNIETTMQSITDLQSVLPNQNRPQRHETGVIDSLFDELQTIQNDIESVYKPVYTKS